MCRRGEKGKGQHSKDQGADWCQFMWKFDEEIYFCIDIDSKPKH